MRVIIGLIFGIFSVPIITILIYAKVQISKKIEPPSLGDKFSDSQNMQDNINGCFKSGNDWVDLVVLYLSVYHVLNIWSVCFSLLTFFVVSFEKNLNENFALAVSLCAIFAIFATVLGLLVKPREMFLKVNPSWEKSWGLMMKFKLDIIGKEEEEVKNLIYQLQDDIKNISETTDFV